MLATATRITKPKADALAGVRELVTEDFAQLDQLILQQLKSRVALVNEVSQHLIFLGGKRTRPLIVLLCAHAAGYQGDMHLQLAVIIELIHTATLLHDDVIDRSQQRRQQKTAHELWGNEASVLVGDFLYSRAFQLMTELKDLDILKLLADATHTIVEGEVMQLQQCHQFSIDQTQYIDIVSAKTAELFKVSAQLGALLSQDNTLVTPMMHFGQQFGIAYQLIDDALDYSGDPQLIGKNLGDDLAEGKPTLPLVLALKRANDSQRATLNTAIQAGHQADFAPVIEIIQSTGALAATQHLAKQYAEKAYQQLAALPESNYRQGLQQLTEFVIERAC